MDMRRLNEEGKLTDYQAEHWFGIRPPEELYDMKNDPYQINNLAADPEYRVDLLRHRRILDRWISETDDKGQYPESSDQLKATYDLWKNLPIFRDADVNQEYDQFQ